MFVIRGLRKEGYGQKGVDLLFKSIVLTYGLSFYGASKGPDLVVMDCFLKRCHFNEVYIFNNIFNNNLFYLKVEQNMITSLLNIL